MCLPTTASKCRAIVHDTMLQSYVLEVHKPHGLSSLAERHLGRSGINYEDLCGKGAHQIPFAQVDVAKASEYSCEDSDQTLDVHRVLWPRLQQSECLPAMAAIRTPGGADLPGLQGIYELEIASSEVLYRIERNGVLIDAPTLAAQSHELGQRIVALENEAYAIAGQPFNLSSPKQLGEIFFDKLGMPVVKKTATGARSTDEEVLEKLAEDYPLPAKLLEHRSLSKLKGTYTDKLAQLAHPRTGRVHTHYAQAVAVTGRLSSNDPNLQNIPIRTPEGRRVREAFVAPPGCVIASADYSQIELRIMAHLSGDEALLHAFTAGLDVHRATAAEVFGVEPRTGQQRAAPLRQGHQLRPDLRHERLRPGEEPGHRDQGRRRLHRPLLPALPRRQALHGRDPARWPRRRATSKPCSAAAWCCPRSTRPTARAAPGPSAPPSTRPCRARRPT